MRLLQGDRIFGLGEGPVSTRNKGEVWALTLRSERKDDLPASYRLKGLLKAALRRFGFRCIKVGERAKPMKTIVVNGENDATWTKSKRSQAAERRPQAGISE
jgi:hypothetical protein